MKNVLILVFASLLPCTVMAKDRKIEGRVLFANDSTEVVGANVMTYLGDTINKVSQTNQQGQFSLSFASKDDVQLKISFVGYKPAVFKIQHGKVNVQFDKIYLIEDSKELKGVEVTAQNYSVDRTLIFPKKQQVSISRDLFGLLETMNLRGLSINPIKESVQVNGQAVQWKINGIPKSHEDVKRINPKDIARIEYSDMPSIRYQDKGIGGVINIILKVKTSGETAWISGSTALTTRFTNANAGADYHWKKSALSLQYSANYRDYDKWKRTKDETFQSDSETIHRATKGNNVPMYSNFHYITANYTGEFSEHTHWSATWRNAIEKQEHIRDENITDSRFESSIHRESESTFWDYIPALDLYLDHTFNNGDNFSANVVATWMNCKSRYTLEDERDGVINTVKTPIDITKYSLISEVNYMHNWNPIAKLTVGYQNTWSNSHNDYLSPINTNTQMTQNNNYLYVSLSGKRNKWSYRFGGGLKAHFVDTNNEEQHYWKPRFSTTLMYAPTSYLNFSLSSTYAPGMPSLGQLSNITQQVDDLLYMVGNPSLKATNYWQTKWVTHYDKKWFSSDVTLWYNHIHQPIFTDYTYLTTQGYFLSHLENAKKRQQLGGKWNARFMGLGKCLNVYTTLGFNRYLSKGNTFSHQLNNWYWSISAQLYHKEWTLAAVYKKPQKQLIGEEIYTDENSSGISLQWKKKNLTLWGMVHYPFEPDGWKYKGHTMNKVVNTYEDITIKDNGHMFVLGCRWSLEFGKKKRSHRKKLQNADYDNGVLRVQ